MEYKDVKNERHVFIHAVCGRSGSTAIQRILNSSNEICIFGESWGINAILLHAINNIQNKYNEKWKSIKPQHLKSLQDSYRDNKHDKFYPNAFREPEALINSLLNSFVELYKPLIDVKRFGYKEISLSDVNGLFLLNKYFKKSIILFCFRDPIKQFVSVKSCNYFSYSNDLNLFLDKYEQVSNVYLEYFENKKEGLFVDYDMIQDLNKFKKLIKYLNISKIDETLLGEKINSTQDFVLKTEDGEKIKKSKAYYNYLKMKKIPSKYF